MHFFLCVNLIAFWSKGFYVICGNIMLCSEGGAKEANICQGGHPGGCRVKIEQDF